MRENAPSMWSIKVAGAAISGFAESIIDASHKLLLGQFLHHQDLQDGSK
jgi:hypothetical protein